MKFLGHMATGPTNIYCDSQGAIQNAKHPNYSDKLRHVQNKIFYVRNVCERGRAKVLWLQGKFNPADLGTKCLGGRPFLMFAEFLMNFKTAPTTTRLARWLKKVPHQLASESKRKN